MRKLEIMKGSAKKVYENTFFREFSKNLNKEFNIKSINGLLIGNSKCEIDKSLEIDALLITNTAILLIDFKKYYGEVTLPNKNDFIDGKWEHQDGNKKNDRGVKGGSSINPYKQLKKQKKKLLSVLEKSIVKNKKNKKKLEPYIKKIVCFQTGIKINKRENIPRKSRSYFFVTNAINYIECINDIIDIDSETGLPIELFKNIFKADKYDIKKDYEQSELANTYAEYKTHNSLLIAEINKKKLLDEYKKSWIYALEAKRLARENSKKILKKEILGQLLNISARKILAERMFTPPPKKLDFYLEIIAYNHGSTELALASKKHIIYIFDTQSGLLKHRLKGHSSRIYSLIYNSKYQLTSTSDDRTIRRWNTKIGEEISLLARPSSVSEHKALFTGEGTKISPFTCNFKKNMIASVSSSGEKIQFKNIKSGEIIYSSQLPSGAYIMALAFNPSGEELVSSSQDSKIRRWNTETGKLIKELEVKGWISSLIYNHDGSKLISVNKVSREFQLWNTTSWQYEAHQVIDNVCFASDGKNFITYSSQYENIELHNHTSLQTSEIHTLTYSLCETIIASSSKKTIQLWNAETGKNIRVEDKTIIYGDDRKIIRSVNGVKFQDLTLEKKSLSNFPNEQLKGSGNVTIFAYNSDHSILAFCSNDSSNNIKLWDVTSKKIKKGIFSCIKRPSGQSYNNQICALAYSPDGKILASATSRNKSIQLWDTENYKLVHVFKECSDDINALIFSPDGNILVSASKNQTLQFWEAKWGRFTSVFLGERFNNLIGDFDRKKNALKYNSDGSILAFIKKKSATERLYLWSEESSQLKQPNVGLVNYVISPINIKAIDFCPNSSTLAYINSHNINILDLKSEKKTCVNKSLLPIFTLSYHPNGKFLAFVLASPTDKQAIYEWNIKDNKVERDFIIEQEHDPYRPSFYPNRDNSHTLTYNPTGTVIAFTPFDEGIVLLEINTNKRTILNKHKGEINSLVYSPDGKMLASASDDKTILLWDIETEAILHTLEGHSESVASLIFSPNGTILISASDDKTIRLWDVKTGEEKFAFEGHSEGVYALAFKPNSNTFASSSYDGTTKIWSLSMLRLFYDFDPARVSKALQFLWEIGLDNNKIVKKLRSPSLLPNNGYYYSDIDLIPLLDMPKPNESKIDQLVRWLDDQK